MANERYAAYDGREAEQVLQPAKTGAVVVAPRRQRSPFFWVERLGDRVITAVLWALSLLWRYGFAGTVVGVKAVRYLLRRLHVLTQRDLAAFHADVRGIRRDLRCDGCIFLYRAEEQEELRQGRHAQARADGRAYDHAGTCR